MGTLGWADGYRYEDRASPEMVGVDWTEVNALATVALVLTSGGAILYAGKQLDSERHYRAATNLEQQWILFRSESYLAIRKRLAEERLSDGGLGKLDLKTPPASAFELLDFYEHLALLEKRGHLDLYDIWHTFYEVLEPTYLDLRPLVESEASEWRTHYNDLRRLMARLRKLQRRRGRGAAGTPGRGTTEERLCEHYRYELESGGRRYL